MDGASARSMSLAETEAGWPAPFRAPDQVDALPEGRRAKVGWRARALAALSGQHALAMIDQGVVSGASFLTTILLGRLCGAGELGTYSLGFSLLVMWACVQESLVALPYTIHWRRSLPEGQAEHAGSVLVQQGLLSALALVGLAGVAAALSLSGAVEGLSTVMWALAGVMPFVLLREFGRRFAFAHFRMAEALVLDGAVASAQLATLAWLAWAGALSATTAYVAMGAACALSGGIWLYLARRNFAVRWEQVRPTMQRSWSLGKWFFASQVTLSVQAYFIHWLLAYSAGATATGVFAACMTVVLFANPLILGLANVLMPRTAQALSEGGGTELRRVVMQTTALLGTAMALFCTVVLFAGEDVMGLLYRGSQYEGHRHTVAVLGLGMLAAALGMPASNGLAALERPDLIFKVGLVALGLSLVLIPCLVVEWGVVGAAYGFLAGNVAGTVGRGIVFTSTLRRRKTASVVQVLQQHTQSGEEDAWVVEPLNEGAQASLFVARRRDGRPIWQTHLELAVKLYKSEGPDDLEVVRGQFESLSQLHARLNDSTLKGWNIAAPAPLYLCQGPLALVMTRVPGRPLSSCLEKAGAEKIALGPIAEAIVAALERYWSIGGQTHGDLNFDNILCDVVPRRLSFVDPGVLETSVLCDGISRHGYPASRDLAYLLYDVAVTVRRALGNPRARQRQQDLVEKILAAFVAGIGPVAQKHQFLDEVDACARAHLDRLDKSWSPRGAWHLVLRHLASRSFAGALNKLRAEAGERGGHP